MVPREGVLKSPRGASALVMKYKCGAVLIHRSIDRSVDVVTRGLLDRLLELSEGVCECQQVPSRSDPV